MSLFVAVEAELKLQMQMQDCSPQRPALGRTPGRETVSSPPGVHAPGRKGTSPPLSLFQPTVISMITTFTVIATASERAPPITKQQGFTFTPFTVIPDRLRPPLQHTKIGSSSALRRSATRTRMCRYTSWEQPTCIRRWMTLGCIRWCYWRKAGTGTTTSYTMSLLTRVP